MGVDVGRIKAAAAGGRWPGIIAELGGVSLERLDGKKHPCPRCGGRDRFRLIDLEAGALFCNKCFAEKNGDGIAALQWLQGWSFKECLERLKRYLGLEGGNGAMHQKKREEKPKKVFSTWKEALAAGERSKAGKYVHHWTYFTADGVEALRKVRFEKPDGGKDFFPFHPREGGWVFGDPPGLLPLYRLPELATRTEVFVFEGEKCADAGCALGLPSTTSAHGADSAKKSDWAPLAGKRVVIVPDHDGAGEKYAADVVRLLHGLDPPAEVKIIRLPGLEDGEDIVEFIGKRRAAGRSNADVRAEIEELVAAAAPEKRATAAEALDVDEEDELQEPVLAYEEFPVDLLPKTARGFVEAGAEAHGVSPGFFVPPLLALAAGVIGASRSVLLKGSYTEPSIIWACVIARSGAGKSPAASEVMKLARPIVSELREEYRRELQEFEEDHRVWKKLSKNPKNDPGEEPKPPAEKRLKVADTTFEALCGILEFNERGLLLIADELATFLDFDRYSGGKAKVGAAKWLPLWKGEEVDCDRRTEGVHIYLPRGYLSVTGSIPPKAFGSVIGEERMSDGLLARFLIASPPDPMTEWSEHVIKDPIFDALEATIRSLHKLALVEGKFGPEPMALPLTRDARSIWTHQYNELVGEAMDMSDAMRAAASKARAYAARIALILSLLDNPDATTVSEVWMAAGWTISLWFLREHRRALGRMSESPAAKDLRIGVELLQRLGGRATVREMCRATRRFGGPGGADRAEAMGDRLVAAGLARWSFSAPGPSGGRPERALFLTQADDDDRTSRFRQESEDVSSSSPPGAEKAGPPREPGEDGPAASGAPRARGGKKARV